jgi:small subunit ribosomal protein S8
MLTRIRNALNAGKDSVEMPHSNMKGEIARILKREGYIIDHTTEGHDGKRILRVYLKYDQEQKPVIQGAKRISRPGLRRYVASKEVKRVLNGLGMAILSTSTGIVTDDEARKRHVGGEVLCHIW